MLNPLQHAQMPNQKAREVLLELKQAANKVECDSINIGGYHLFITPERWEAYKDNVKRLIRTYNRFIKAMNDDGVR